MSSNSNCGKGCYQRSNYYNCSSLHTICLTQWFLGILLLFLMILSC